jgi:hypothetical protein
MFGNRALIRIVVPEWEAGENCTMRTAIIRVRDQWSALVNIVINPRVS